MKEINNIIRYAKKLKFKVEMTKKCHYKFIGFNHIVYASSTTSDYRAYLKIRKSLEKISKGTHISHV
ncbi:MAG: hypothetical protein DRG78_16025 [Epsilonproteobacteria bacterium]|nr:MAG: hypothetical protein DRG78_16025 [Campylobacterota bacterium]